MMLREFWTKEVLELDGTILQLFCDHIGLRLQVKVTPFGALHRLKASNTSLLFAVGAETSPSILMLRGRRGAARIVSKAKVSGSRSSAGAAVIRIWSSETRPAATAACTSAKMAPAPIGAEVRASRARDSRRTAHMRPELSVAMKLSVSSSALTTRPLRRRQPMRRSKSAACASEGRSPHRRWSRRSRGWASRAARAGRSGWGPECRAGGPNKASRRGVRRQDTQPAPPTPPPTPYGGSSNAWKRRGVQGAEEAEAEKAHMSRRISRHSGRRRTAAKPRTARGFAATGPAFWGGATWRERPIQGNLRDFTSSFSTWN